MNRLLGIFLALFFTLPLLADNTISVSSASGLPGEEVDIIIGLNNTDNIVAAEFVMPLNSNVSYVENSVALTSSRSDGHMISASGDDNQLKIYIYSIANKALVGNSGALCSFRLKLGSRAEILALNPTVTLSDVNGGKKSSTVSAGNAKILAPELSIITPMIDFGHVPIRGTYSKIMTLKNTGTSVLHVSDITFSTAELCAVDENFDIAVGATHSVTVRYAPVRHGAINATARVVSDAVNNDCTAAIVADPYSVNELHVGSATGNSDTEVTVDISMNNMESIVAAQWSFTLPSALKYIEGSVQTNNHSAGLTSTATLNGNILTVYLYSTDNTAIPEGNGKIASLRFALQGRSGTYTLTPSDIVLSNADMENMLSAKYNGSVRIYSPTISVASSLSMPELPVTETVQQDLTIRNTGQTDLIIDRVTFLQEGFEMTNSLPLTIAGNTSANITLQYHTSTAGNYATTMQIYSNDPETRLKSVAVTGTTFEPNTIALSGEWTEAGDVLTMNIALDNYTDIVAAQMDIHLPEGANITNVANALTLTERLQGLSATITELSADTYRLVLFSFTNQSIRGHNGDILSVSIDVQDAYALNSSNISVDNIMLSGASGNNFASVTSSMFVLPEYNNTGDVDGDRRVTTDHLYATALQYDQDAELYYFDVYVEGSTIYSGFGVDIRLPEGLEAVEDEGKPAIYMLDDEWIDKSEVIFPKTGGVKKTYTHQVLSSFPPPSEPSHVRVACLSTVNANLTAASGPLFRVYVVVTCTDRDWPIGNIRFYDVQLNQAVPGDIISYYPEDRNTTVLMREGETTLPLTVSPAVQWATCILPFATDIPDGVAAYTSVAHDAENVILKQTDRIEAYTPYMLYSEGGFSGTVSGTVSNDARINDAYVNVGNLNGALVPQNTYSGYVLQDHDGEVAFYPINELNPVTMPSGKCWVTLPAGMRANMMRIMIEDQTTAVQMSDATDNTPIYTLQGLKVNNTHSSALYIKAGKKFIKK